MRRNNALKSGKVPGWLSVRRAVIYRVSVAGLNKPRERKMQPTRTHFLKLSVAAAALMAALPSLASAQTAPAVKIGTADIGGVVSGDKGPEAGVWVIAETTDLATKFAKIVVTDERGRYVLPALPKANYSVWVRGYGLVDSAKVTAAPGNQLNLKAVTAPNAKAAAAYYPAISWYSMIKIPGKSEFPGTGPNGNGIAPVMQSQQQFLDNVKTDGCYTCHQLGNQATRTVPKEFGTFNSGSEAWQRRVQSGQASGSMVNAISRMGSRAYDMFGDWTDRIAEGELPVAAPPRPQGLERNVVISVWDWADAKHYLHDEIATDRRNPTVNAYGAIYGSPEESTDRVPVLEPAKHAASHIVVPVRDPKTPSSKTNPILAPSAYWGEEAIWDSQTTVHNPMLDEQGRVWLTTRIRPQETPDFCRAGSSHPSAKAFPIDRSGRQLSVYDPKTKKFTLIDTCYGTHHLQFAADANHTLWTSGGGQVLGWLNRKMFDETGDEQKSQGWTALVLDTNGNGKRDAYVEPNQPLDFTKDKRITTGFYGVAPNPADGSIWGSSLGMPGGVVRVVPGSDPSTTALTEFFEVPWDDTSVPMRGYSPRGVDIDRQGVVWVPLASGHMGSFDRRKCKGPLNGPNATGKHCPKGWALYPFPGPQFAGLNETGSAEASYYTWVDQHNTIGLGNDVPLATGNANEALMAFVDGKWVVMRVPYPMGFYAKGMDGRIDDANAGWKGRGLWSTYGTRAPFHSEGGKGTPSKVLQFQIRPDPLAL